MIHNHEWRIPLTAIQVNDLFSLSANSTTVQCHNSHFTHACDSNWMHSLVGWLVLCWYAWFLLLLVSICFACLYDVRNCRRTRLKIHQLGSIGMSMLSILLACVTLFFFLPFPSLSVSVLIRSHLLIPWRLKLLLAVYVHYGISRI